MRLRLCRSKRGNAILEFALSASVLIPCVAGTFQFGYGMYTYNRLQNAVDDGGRYASMRTYRCLAGATDVAKVQLAVKNVAVYGTTSPTASSVPVVNGFGTDKVNVQYTLTSSGVPTSVTVNVSSFTIDTIFTSYTITAKPVVTFSYLGRYAPQESEP
jgi:Flp pilus assembly protein TadG